MTNPSSVSASYIAFQGHHGAYSDLACRNYFPDLTPLPCESFEDAFQAVSGHQADLALIPVDNSVAGRVADVHHLMPHMDLYIIGERFQRVSHYLLGLKEARIEDLRTVRSHVHALSQCRNLIRSLGLTAEVVADTAGAAKMIVEAGDPTVAAIASPLAADLYGLKVLQRNIEDAQHNTTRFLVLSRENQWAAQGEKHLLTTFMFHVRSVPAALYKALGGFATNGINLTKLESYLLDGSFEAAQFYVDAEGHPEDESLALALRELSFFSHWVRILGVYISDPFRRTHVTTDIE